VRSGDAGAEARPLSLDASPAVVRCAQLAREQRADPIGSAGTYELFVLVEHPLPWPAAITDDPLFADVSSTARRLLGPTTNVRLQAIAREGTDSHHRTVIVYRRDGNGPFVRYERQERHDIASHEIPGAVATMLTTRTFAGEEPDVTDVLVCTHGTRDRCCGSLGTRLWQATRSSGLARVWRTSHTGGHRFAPTVITFPQAQYWAFVEEATLEGIVQRTLATRDLAPFYRGSAAFDAHLQVAEREALIRHGWEWLDWPRRGTRASDGRARLEFVDGDGVHRAYEAWITPGRELSTPPCGSTVTNDSPLSAEWHVERFVEVPTAHR
jgi:hypothetical protein